MPILGGFESHFQVQIRSQWSPLNTFQSSTMTSCCLAVCRAKERYAPLRGFAPTQRFSFCPGRIRTVDHGRDISDIPWIKISTVKSPGEQEKETSAERFLEMTNGSQTHRKKIKHILTSCTFQPNSKPQTCFAAINRP